MTISSLERRLRKIEAARSNAAGFFVAWGRTEAEAQDALAHARELGTVRPADEFATAVWPDAGPLPRSRWLILDRAHEHEITDREIEVLCRAMRAEAAEAERADALAAGEDIMGLDAIDFFVRHLRRTSRDLTRDLRMLALDEVPRPEVHSPDLTNGNVRQCICARCRAGETTPMGAHARHRARQAAWLSRYLPGEELFA